MIMLILVVHTFSVGLRGALDLEQSYTVDIHTVNSTDGEIQKFSGGRMDWEERGDIRWQWSWMGEEDTEFREDTQEIEEVNTEI